MNVPHPTLGAYPSYSQRRRELHAFIREGEGDSDEADAIRDEMDDFYFQLTPEEIGRLESLSADLHVIGESESLSEDRPTALATRQQLLEAGLREDWAGFRSLLDADADSADLFDRILFRAIYWAALRDHESSLEFLESLAKRIEEDRSRIEGMQPGLDRLARIGKAYEIAVVRELGQLVLGRMAHVSEEIDRLILDVRSMISSEDAVGDDPAPWDAVKARFFRAEERFRAFQEAAA